MNPEHDSAPDTNAHITRVRELMRKCIENLAERGIAHDVSKLFEPEKSAFDRLKALSLSGMAYGSPEYKACLADEKPAIEHHYKHNSHHPEHFSKKDGGLLVAMLRATAAAQKEQATDAMSTEPEAATALLRTSERIKAHADELEAEVNHMTLFDVIEMLMDWKAATERMKDGGDIHRSLEINTERFKLSPQLASILANTIREMQWPKPATK